MRAVAFYFTAFGFSCGTLVMAAIHSHDRLWPMLIAVPLLGLCAVNSYRSRSHDD